MKLYRHALVLVCLFGGALAHADASDPDATLKDDFKRLMGKWRKETNDLNLMFNFEDGAVQITISGLRGASGFSGAGVGRFSEVKEDARCRFFELAASTAEGCGLPQRIHYHFDQDKLVLDVSAGVLKGQHELVRDEGLFQSYTFWIVAAVLVAGLLVVGGLVIRRRRAGAVAEPHASADGWRDSGSS